MAAKAGLKRGVKVRSINGCVMAGLTHAQSVTILKVPTVCYVPTSKPILLFIRYLPAHGVILIVGCPMSLNYFVIGIGHVFSRCITLPFHLLNIQNCKVTD